MILMTRHLCAVEFLPISPMPDSSLTPSLATTAVPLSIRREADRRKVLTFPNDTTLGFILRGMKEIYSTCPPKGAHLDPDCIGFNQWADLITYLGCPKTVHSPMRLIH